MPLVPVVTEARPAVGKIAARYVALELGHAVLAAAALALAVLALGLGCACRPPLTV